MIDYTATYTDQYEITMAQVYFHKSNINNHAIFDYFFRKQPFEGGYTIFSGLEDLLQAIEKFQFDQRDLALLQEEGLDKKFLQYLEDFHFSGTLYACREGDLIFPNRPVLSIEAPIIEAQLLETLVLNILNYQSLIATKASRMRRVANNKKLIDFGLRRAPGPGGYYASRAAFIGGFNATSNVRAGRDYQIPVSGTMAHSFVQSYDNELSSFRDFAEIRSNDCVLLVDTYDTLNSGIPNAITVAKEMEERGDRLKGVRLDSGDLAWLAKETRKMLDKAGLGYVKIAASNQLDEYVIKSLLQQDAPVDLFGVGTSLVTGCPDAALDGVYKLAYAHNNPRLKLSETPEKINLPGRKQVYRLINNNGMFYGGDVVTRAEESSVNTMVHPTLETKSLDIQTMEKRPLLHKVMENGIRIAEPKTLNEIASFCQHQLELLPEEFKRFENPHLYKVGLSSSLKQLRNNLISQFQNHGSQTVDQT